MYEPHPVNLKTDECSLLWVDLNGPLLPSLVLFIGFAHIEHNRAASDVLFPPSLLAICLAV